MDYLSELSSLQREFDGPIPEMAILAARHGSPEAVQLLHAVAQRKFFHEFASRQIKAIRMRREDGTFYPAMLADLRYYFRNFRRYHRQALRIKRGMA